MFWQKGLEVPVLTSAITRDRYFRIKNSLKAVIDTDISDETKKRDRLWEVCPVLDRVHAGCLQITRDRDVSIDEQMIPFTGACELQQYEPNKPNPVGLKNFVAASHDGLVVDFCDRMISYYRMKTRTKKWTIRTVTHFFRPGCCEFLDSVLQRQENSSGAT